MSRSNAVPLSSILGCTALGTLAALPASAAEMTLKLQLPEMQTPSYQRPYVAVWIEKADDTYVSTLSLWHMVKSKRGEIQPNGDRYLNTLRDWWKQSGTTSQMPIDGLSSATRAPGEHELAFAQGQAPLNKLAPGNYQLVLEAAREVKGPRPAGGFPQDGPPLERGMGGGASKDSAEVVRVNFEWPVKKTTTVTAKGTTEFGNISLVMKP
jgi:hypothetical protein